MKVKDAIAWIHAQGWYQVAQRGSHRQFKHPTRRGRVTIAGKGSEELARGTWKNIQKQARGKP